MKKYYPGSVVEGKVIGIKPYGVFVALDEQMVGLLHISEITDGFVDDINNFVKIDEVIETKILDVDYGENRAKLSLKALKKRNRYRKGKFSFSEERIKVEKEFFALKVRMDDFIEDAEKRLNK